MAHLKIRSDKQPLLWPHLCHTKKVSLNTEYDQVYDLQTDDLLASAYIKNGKKSGIIFDHDYKQKPLCAGGCPANLSDQQWQATEDYMDEIMAEPPKQLRFT